MLDIIMPTYGDLDRKTLLEDIDGKISVQTDDTIGRTAEGKLTVVGGGGGAGTVTSVNSVLPDANGNVQLVANDVGALAIENYTPRNDVLKGAVHAGSFDANTLIAGDYKLIQNGSPNSPPTLASSTYIETKDIYTANGASFQMAVPFTNDSAGDSGEIWFRNKNQTDLAWRSWRKIYDSEKPPTAEEVGADKKTYRHPAELGLTTPTTCIEIARAMADNTRCIILSTNGDVISDAPSQNGTLVIEKRSRYRVIAEYHDDINFNVYYGVLLGGSDITIATLRWDKILTDVGGDFKGSIAVEQTDGWGEKNIILRTSDGLTSMYMFLNDASTQNNYGIFHNNPLTSGYIVHIARDTGAVTSNYFASKTTALLDNIQAVPANQLIDYEEEIQDKIIELEFKLEKANIKGFTKLATTTQSQLDILNQKLSEIV